MIEELERKLDSFDGGQRRAALLELSEKVAAGQVDLPEPGTDVNIHCHTFFSYNTYGYSPSKFAWLARERGLAVAGVVDFDVLDALEEFLYASDFWASRAWQDWNRASSYLNSQIRS